MTFTHRIFIATSFGILALTGVGLMAATIHATTRYDIVAMLDQLVNFIPTEMVKHAVTEIANHAHGYALLFLMPFTSFNRVMIHVHGALAMMLGPDAATIFVLTVYLFAVHAIVGYVKFITSLVRGLWRCTIGLMIRILCWVHRIFGTGMLLMIVAAAAGLAVYERTW